jgi:hypothetical protein
MQFKYIGVVVLGCLAVTNVTAEERALDFTGTAVTTTGSPYGGQNVRLRLVFNPATALAQEQSEAWVMYYHVPTRFELYGSTGSLIESGQFDESQGFVSLQKDFYYDGLYRDSFVIWGGAANGSVFSVSCEASVYLHHALVGLISSLSLAEFTINSTVLPDTTSANPPICNVYDATRAVPNIYFGIESVVDPARPSLSAQLTALAGEVMALNLSAGISNSLDSKLDAALAAMDSARKGDVTSAANMLYAFITAVQAQAGKAIGVEDAGRLVEHAQAIVNELQ